MATKEIIALDEATPQLLAPQTGDTYLAPRTINITPEANTSGLVITGGTATANAPVLDLTQTWNNAAVTFTGLKFNADGSSSTNSASGSLLMDLQVGGASKFNVTKAGVVVSPGIQNNSVSSSANFALYNDALDIRSSSRIRWSNSTTISTLDLVLARDDAGVLAQRNSTNAQTFRIYNTYTDASNYERGKIAWESNVLKIGTEKAGTGTARALELQTNGITRLTLGASGDLFTQASTSVYVHIRATASTSASLNCPADGVLLLTNWNINDFNRLQFGGTTSSFPALKRSGAGLISRLADDSADAAFTASTLTASSSAANTSAIASTGYSLTGSSAVSMVDLAGTWNTTGVPTLIKANVVNNASGSGSLLIDLQVGGVTQFRVDKEGRARLLTDLWLQSDATNRGLFFGSAGDIVLHRDAAGVLAQRNANNGQAFRLYGRYTDATNDFERFFITASGTAGAAVQLGTQKGAVAGTARALELQTDGNTRLTISTAGAITTGVGVDFFVNSSRFLGFSASTLLYAPSNGVLGLYNAATTDFNRLQFGGSTSSFPALKRSSATLISRLADDSANAAFEAASLKTDAPAGGTAATWKLGAVATVSPTSPNRTIEVDIGGTIYYLHAKTTND